MHTKYEALHFIALHFIEKIAIWDLFHLSLKPYLNDQ